MTLIKGSQTFKVEPLPNNLYLVINVTYNHLNTQGYYASHQELQIFFNLKDLLWTSQPSE